MSISSLLMTTPWREWIFASGALAIMSGIASGVYALLKGLHRKHGSPFSLKLAELAPTIRGVLRILGLKLSIDLAPLSGIVGHWLESGAYLLVAIVLLRLIQRAALVGMEWSTLRFDNSEIMNQGFIPIMRN